MRHHIDNERRVIVDVLCEREAPRERWPCRLIRLHGRRWEEEGERDVEGLSPRERVALPSNDHHPRRANIIRLWRQLVGHHLDRRNARMSSKLAMDFRFRTASRRSRSTPQGRRVQSGRGSRGWAA